MVILLLVMYSFSVLFMAMIVSHLGTLEAGDKEENPLIGDLELTYGSMYKVMSLLFRGVTGGDDWAVLAEPVQQISESFYLVFGGYIVFVTFGMMNIVTGYFVDGTMLVSSASREQMVEDALARKCQITEVVCETLHIMDTDGSGAISLDELEQNLNNVTVSESLLALNISSEEVERLFKMLDVSGSGLVPIDDLVAAFLRIMAPVKSLDIAVILAQIKELSNYVGELKQSVMADRVH
eukprot:NODE_2044_length_1007_cov_376.704832.p1 GENE.NODE_2044_length_1007_cov_376.704832~~NODE_2044_length_1007_cov_376.704832.p1  ORF type:complete len:273 (-),score=75.62 NODE_2044_length_1007_cov_376.704832:173-886(-)